MSFYKKRNAITQYYSYPMIGSIRLTKELYISQSRDLSGLLYIYMQGLISVCYYVYSGF